MARKSKPRQPRDLVIDGRMCAESYYTSLGDRQVMIYETVSSCPRDAGRLASWCTKAATWMRAGAR